MRYRKLDAGGDMQFGHGAGDMWKDVPDAVGQSIKTRLLLYTGEWFLDLTAGTPWGGFPLNQQVVQRGRILAEHTQLSRDAAIRDRIVTTVGVQTLSTYGSSFNPNTRGFSVNATVDTIYGGIIAVAITAGEFGAQPQVMTRTIRPATTGVSAVTMTTKPPPAPPFVLPPAAATKPSPPLLTARQLYQAHQHYARTK